MVVLVRGADCERWGERVKGKGRGELGNRGRQDVQSGSQSRPKRMTTRRSSSVRID